MHNGMHDCRFRIPGACGCSRHRKLDGYWTCQLLERGVFDIQKRALPAPARSGRRTPEVISPEVISRTSAARSRRSRTVFRSEETSSTLTRVERSVPEPKSVATGGGPRHPDGSEIVSSMTGTDVYGITEEEARPVEAIRALNETRSVLSERCEGVHRLPRRVLPPGGMARLCTKGILYRGSSSSQEPGVRLTQRAEAAETRPEGLLARSSQDRYPPVIRQWGRFVVVTTVDDEKKPRRASP
jgi:hypothetical protein